MTRCGANPPRSLGFHHLSRGAFQKLSKSVKRWEGERGEGRGCTCNRISLTENPGGHSRVSA